jgi:hypothetical protein
VKTLDSPVIVTTGVRMGFQEFTAGLLELGCDADRTGEQHDARDRNSNGFDLVLRTNE